MNEQCSAGFYFALSWTPPSSHQPQINQSTVGTQGGGVGWWVSRKLRIMRPWVNSRQVLCQREVQVLPWLKPCGPSEFSMLWPLHFPSDPRRLLLPLLFPFFIQAQSDVPWSFTYSFILRCHIKCFWHLYCAILIGRKAPYFSNHWQNAVRWNRSSVPNDGFRRLPETFVMKLWIFNIIQCSEKYKVYLKPSELCYTCWEGEKAGGAKRVNKCALRYFGQCWVSSVLGEVLCWCLCLTVLSHPF